MSTSFYNLFQNSVISVSTRNYIFILKRLSTNIDFIQCLLTNKQSLRTTVQLLQYKELRYATPNFKILQTFFYLSLYGRFLYLTYYIQYLLIISIKTTPSNRMALFNKDLCSLVGGPGYRGPHKLNIRAIVSLQIRVHVRDTRISSVCIRDQLSLLTREDKALIPTSLQIPIIVGLHYANQLCCSHCYPLVR